MGASTPPKWRIWFQAIRFPSFTTSTIPIIVGSALALVDGALDPLRFLAMLLASMLTHAGCNLANDFYDHQRGVDTTESLGPSGVIQRGWLTPGHVRSGMVVCFALATLLGIWIAAVSGLGIFWLALASLGAAFLYTGGPAPLAYLALGELTVFLFMGVGMVSGAYYVHAGRLSATALLLGTAVGLLAAAILHANNVRDIASDRARDKRTLANLLPRSAATSEYAALLGGAYVAVLATVAAAPSLWQLVIVGLTLPRALRLIRAIAESPHPQSNGQGSRVEGRDDDLLGPRSSALTPSSSVLRLNRVLRQTAGLHLRFGVLATLGLLLATALDRWG